MACLVTLCLLLVLPLSWSQSTLQSEQINAQPHPGDPPPPQPPRPASPHLRDLLRNEETSHLSAKQTYAHAEKDNGKVGLFVATAVGTISLMAAVYCIYNKFYTKHQYLHTQLHDDPELTLDPTEPPPVFVRGSVGSTLSVGRAAAGYGSLSDTPSIISVPPGLSPPPSVIPLPPLFLSSNSLRTISAKDLEKSFL